MKKNILKTLTVLFAFVLFTLNISAVTQPTDEAARVPSRIPDVGAKLYATVQDPFDYSKIKFVNGSNQVSGSTTMRKIVMTDKFEYAETGGDIGVGTDWFSAYCLDGRLKYPENGIYFASRNNVTTYEDFLKVMVEQALLNQSNTTNEMYQLFKEARNYKAAFTAEFTTPGYNDAQSAVESMKTTKTLTVNISRVIFANAQGATKIITAAQLNAAAGKTGDVFELVINATVEENNYLFDIYTVKAMDKTISYNRALWMIEHSYPSLSLKDSLAIAGADYDKLTNEIKTLETSATTAELEKLVENYVYSTIQYAIWKVNDGVDMAGNTLGKELTGSEELNKLYKYLIEDKGNSFYASYGENTFSGTLSITKPTAKNEIYEQTNEIYKYGPFNVQGGFIETGKIYLNVKDADKNGVKLVNKNGDEITEVNPGEEFYVVANKKSKIANVTIEASAPGAKKFVPDGNRGRVYYANSALGQNVITGGKIETTATNQSFELLFNPSTGVEDVGMLFIVTIAAFAVGYFVLTRKNQPVEL